MFYTPINNVAGLQLASPRSAGGTSLVLLPGQGGRVTALPTRVTVVTAGSYGTSAEVLTIFGVTGVSGDTLTISGPLEGTTDRGYAAGDYAEELAAEMLATTLNVEFDPDRSWDEKKEIYRISNKIVRTANVTQSAVGDKRGLWTTVIASAVLIFD